MRKLPVLNIGLVFRFDSYYFKSCSRKRNRFVQRNWGSQETMKDRDGLKSTMPFGHG